MSKTLHKSLESKLAMLDGPEWESDDEEMEEPAATETLKRKKNSGSARDGKRKKENSVETKKAVTGPEASSVVYIGHLPAGFEENELLNFFSQFGNIVNLKVSRSKRTGNSRGHGFVQFADEDVAAIVAQTMSGYLLMGEKVLVCHVLPKDKIHPFLFKGVSLKSLALRSKKMKGHESLIKYWQEQHKEIVNGLDTRERMTKITQRLVEKEKNKRKKLAELGIDYDFPGYSAGLDNNASPPSTDSSKKTQTQNKYEEVAHLKPNTKVEKSPPLLDLKKKKDESVVKKQEPDLKKLQSNNKGTAVTQSSSTNNHSTKNEAGAAEKTGKPNSEEVKPATTILNNPTTTKSESLLQKKPEEVKPATTSPKNPTKSESQVQKKSEELKAVTTIPKIPTTTKSESTLQKKGQVLSKNEIKTGNTKSSSDSKEKVHKIDPDLKKRTDFATSSRTGTFKDNKAISKQQNKMGKNTGNSLSKANTTTEKHSLSKGSTTSSAKSHANATVNKGQGSASISVPNQAQKGPMPQATANPASVKKANQDQKDDSKSSLGFKPQALSGAKNVVSASHSIPKKTSQISKPKIDIPKEKTSNPNVMKGANHGPVPSPKKRKNMDESKEKSASQSAKVLKTSAVVQSSLATTKKI